MWFSAVSQARSPRLQSQLCPCLVVLSWERCVTVFDFCFSIWKIEKAMPSYNPSQDGYGVQYWFSVLKGFWNMKSSKEMEPFFPNIKKEKKIECMGRSHWLWNKCFVTSRIFLQQCPHVQLSLSLLVWRHEPGIKSSGRRTELTALSVEGLSSCVTLGSLLNISVSISSQKKWRNCLPNPMVPMHWNIFNVKTCPDQFHCWDFLYTTDTKSKQGNGTYNILKMSVLT